MQDKLILCAVKLMVGHISAEELLVVFAPNYQSQKVMYLNGRDVRTGPSQMTRCQS